MLLPGLLIGFQAPLQAQNDVMLQGFYWNVPVDAENKKGQWWNTLRTQAEEFKSWGITGIWVPSPAKGNWGIYDMGYGIYDHYDLGNYAQKGSVETRFGSRAELEQMLSAMHDTAQGQPRVEVYADIVLNHIYGGEDNLEPNPAVKAYVFDEARRHGKQFTPYPTNEVLWRLPKAAAGDYYLKIKGYHLDYEAGPEARAYDLQVDYVASGWKDAYTWELEPNNGQGTFQDFPSSGQTLRAFIQDEHDVDVFKVSVPGGQDLVFRLSPRFSHETGWWSGDPTHGYYPFELWYEGEDLAPTHLQAMTTTALSFPSKAGRGEENMTWNYRHFHPADDNDWLGDWGEGDGLITNTKGFGNDLNTFDAEVQERLNRWGEWLTRELDFDGYRLDFVRGFQYEFAASWINSIPLKDGRQRFVVGEYWGETQSIQQWVHALAELGADADAFDFPLKATLTEMCNGDAQFDMRRLNHAGLVRNNEGHGLSGTSVVTFLENHDTGKEHDKWVQKDWGLGYAYILTHEGRPCVFYPHLYGLDLVDYHVPDQGVEIPAALRETLVALIDLRRKHLDGGLEVLSAVGQPYPAEDARHVYVARRGGAAGKEGGIIVLNNAPEQKGLWVDSSPEGWSSWAGETLVNVQHPQEQVQVQADGRVYVQAPSRSFAVYVPQKDLSRP